jgi:dihydrofolate synthase/folylpolyglutamate synthase
MKYSEAIEFMYNALPMFHRQGKSAFKKDLTNIKALCLALGNPHAHLKCIHIAGTNGKGSVSHMLSAVLQANGYKTGLYVSPHYIDFRERIKVNGNYVSRSYVCDFIEKNKKLFDEISPSFFEMTVALAFNYFRDQKVDYAVIETGLGGRLDSTNIIQPLLSIITNISWDHSDILGDSLEKIAFEKAGIIKKNTPVLIGRKQPETDRVFKTATLNMEADLYYSNKLIEN